MDLVRLGEATGIVHYLIVYELAYFWRRTGLIFDSLERIEEFVEVYFKVIELNCKLALEAAEIKIKGDELLKRAAEPTLRKRKLSSADATTLALALNLDAHLVTGDKDLGYVAERMGVKVVW